MPLYVMKKFNGITAEEAEQKFWDFINEDMPLPQNIYDVDGVEEKTE